METFVETNVGYSTRYYKQPENFDQAWQIIGLLNEPPHQPKTAAIFAVEDNKWIVSMATIGEGYYPPTDDVGFLNFAKSIPNKKVYELIKDAKPISSIFGYRFKGSRLYHYEKLSKWPENFAVCGDAACTFNPLYGQGMTVSILGAELLNNILHKRIDKNTKKINIENFGKEFQKKLAKVNSYPWFLATSEDFRWPTTKGKKSDNPLMKLLQIYFDKVLLLIPHSKQATLAFFEMMHMTKSPIVVFHPRIILQVLMRKWNKK